MSHLGLSDSFLFASNISTRSLTGTAVNGTAVDMGASGGWDGISFLIQAGVFGANGTLDGLVQMAPDSGFNTVTNVTNSNLTQIPAANANSIAMIEVWLPSQRYVRLQLTGQTNGVTAGATSICFRREGVLPPPQGAQQIVKVVSQ